MALGRGSEFRQPLGIVIIGGLTLSALLTLLVIPCTYTVFDDISNWFGRVVSRRGKDVEDLYGGDRAEGEAQPTLTSPRATGYTSPSGRVESD